MGLASPPSALVVPDDLFDDPIKTFKELELYFKIIILGIMLQEEFCCVHSRFYVIKFHLFLLISLQSVVTTKPHLLGTS